MSDITGRLIRAITRAWAVVPRATSTDVRFEDLTEAENDEYVRRFLPPRFDRTRDRVLCFLCGLELTDSFRWGIAWGEGTCGGCGWPGRALHRCGDHVAELVLQYHPAEVTE